MKLNSFKFQCYILFIGMWILFVCLLKSVSWDRCDTTILCIFCIYCYAMLYIIEERQNGKKFWNIRAESKMLFLKWKGKEYDRWNNIYVSMSVHAHKWIRIQECTDHAFLLPAVKSHLKLKTKFGSLLKIHTRTHICAMCAWRRWWLRITAADGSKKEKRPTAEKLPNVVDGFFKRR